MSILSKNHFLIGSLALLVLASGAWWSMAKDPKRQFMEQMREIASMGNNAEHDKIESYLSEDFKAIFERRPYKMQDVLTLVKREDVLENRRYRVRNLSVFHPWDYAEIEFERSSKGGGFATEGGLFTVPFEWDAQSKHWKVSSSFRRDGAEWDFPR